MKAHIVTSIVITILMLSYEASATVLSKEALNRKCTEETNKATGPYTNSRERTRMYSNCYKGYVTSLSTDEQWEFENQLAQPKDAAPASPLATKAFKSYERLKGTYTHSEECLKANHGDLEFMAYSTLANRKNNQSAVDWEKMRRGFGRSGDSVLKDDITRQNKMTADIEAACEKNKSQNSG
jgi:hypothetical protein